MSRIGPDMNTYQEVGAPNSLVDFRTGDKCPAEKRLRTPSRPRPSRLPYLVPLAGMLALVALVMCLKLRRRSTRAPAYTSVHTSADDDEFGGSGTVEMA